MESFSSRNYSCWSLNPHLCSSSSSLNSSRFWSIGELARTDPTKGPTCVALATVRFSLQRATGVCRFLCRRNLPFLAFYLTLPHRRPGSGPRTTARNRFPPVGGHSNLRIILHFRGEQDVTNNLNWGNPGRNIQQAGPECATELAAGSCSLSTSRQDCPDRVHGNGSNRSRSNLDEKVLDFGDPRCFLGSRDSTHEACCQWSVVVFETQYFLGRRITVVERFLRPT